MDVICPNCGEVNPAGAQFCSNCKDFLAWDGTALIRKPSEGTAAASPQPVKPVAAPAPPPTPPVPTRGPTPGAPSIGPGTPGPVPRQAVPGPTGQPSFPAGQPAGGQAPTAAPVGVAPRPAAPPTTKACPTCGQINTRNVRFCTRCGYCFVRLKVPQASRQTPAELAAADRVARRTYRRSLPPFYRWRRVGIAVLAAVLVVLAGVVTRWDPGRFLKDGWYWLNKEYVPVTPLSVDVDPTTVAQGSDKARLVDGTVKEFTMNWVPGSVSTCGPASGTAWVTLNIEPARIRRIVIYPGLDVGNPERTLQPLPKTLGVRFGDAPCQAVGLGAAPGPVLLNLDSGQEVSQVHLAIAEAFPGGTASAISITEVVLKKYPD